MPRARKSPRARPLGEVIDFDEGLVATCPAPIRHELQAEAEMLTGAFVGSEDPKALRRMARALVRTGGQTRDERLHTRRLAAIIRLRARSLSEDSG